MKRHVPSIHDIASIHLNKLCELLTNLEFSHIERIYARINAARNKGANIFVAGNGGSAATAAHWVNDLGQAVKLPGRRHIRIMNLTDNMPWLTSLANDHGYEYVFSRQLENFAQVDDVLIVVSASGNSRNLLHAVNFVKDRGGTTIGLLGFDGGLLKDVVDDYLWIPTDKGSYQLVEGCHMIICDILTLCFINDCKDSDEIL